MLIRPPGGVPARRPASTWVAANFVLMAASLVFVGVAAASYHVQLRTERNVAQVSADLSDRTSYSSSDQDLLKARIGFARRIGL
jgi:hypothetical protein